MKRKIMKILIIIAMIILVVLTISEVFATDEVFDVGNFKGKSPTEGVSQIRKVLAGVLLIIRIAGAGIAIIILISLGAKYMLASAGEKADIKKHATTYVIGAVVMMAASGILGIIQNFVSNSTTIS